MLGMIGARSVLRACEAACSHCPASRGHQLSLRGDGGGFGVGSDFCWQAIAAYGWDFARYNNITFLGVLGYRALYVDYAQGRVGSATSSTCSSTARSSGSARGSS
jgi:hypothetical protein